MMNKKVQQKFLIFLLCLAVILVAFPSYGSEQIESSALDIVIKINKLGDTLNLIDELMNSTSQQTMTSPTALMRGMLQGTDWIDPARSIVVGFKLKNTQPDMALLIPFKQPNDSFMTMFNAASGPDYYIIKLPPGQEGPLADEVKASLAAASKTKSQSLLTLKFAVNELLKKAEPQIKEGIDKIERPNNQRDPAFGPTPGVVKDSLLKMLAVGEQVETLLIGLDLNREFFTSTFEAEAVKGSELARLYSPANKITLMNMYKPNQQINFRSHSFDLVGIMELFNTCFGGLYKEIGIDFSNFAELCEYFTGEMAGGMTFGKDSVSLEMISVLKDSKQNSEFLEAVYIPWHLKLSQDMADLVESQTGQKMEPFFIRTPDSTIAGYKVLGIKTQIPSLQFPSVTSENNVSNNQIGFETRMTRIGNLLLCASDDSRLKELINIAATLKNGPVKGPLMAFEVDMAGYLNAITEMIPGFARDAHPLPDMGRAVSKVDMKDGRFLATNSIRIDDIKTLVGYFKDIKPAQMQTRSNATEAVARAPEVKRPVKHASMVNVSAKTSAKITAEDVKEKVARSSEIKVPLKRSTVKKTQTKSQTVAIADDYTVKDAHYWFNKGSLCATYGNDKAAIGFFKKTLQLDPQRSDAHFELGISYGEIGQYQKAISSINNALNLGGRPGLYYYGRGRVYLLSGETDKAIEDFKKAASLDNRDAQSYMQNIARLHVTK